MIQDPSFLIGIYLLGIALILSKGCFHHGGEINKLALIFWLIGVWPIVTNLMVPRQLDFVLFGGAGWHMDYEWSPVLIWAGRLTSLSLLACLFSCIVQTKNHGLPSPGNSLWISFLLFSFSAIAACLFGFPGGGFSKSLLMPAVFITTMYLVVNQSPAMVIIYTQRVCLTYIYFSLLVAVIIPEWAVLTGVQGVVPGMTSRLFGVASNANGLAPIALLYLFLDIDTSNRTFFNRVARLSALFVLVWSQSKTVWVAAIVGYSLKLWFGSSKSGISIYSHKGIVRLLAIMILFLAVLWILMSPESNNHNFVYGQAGFENLTGRTTLWKITIEEWQKNPIFGYGLTLWDEAFRIKHFGFNADFATHAHNMFVQQLGESGIVGFILLFIFIVVLIRTAWLIRDQFNGLSLALVSIPIVRCLTESALNIRVIGETTYVNLAIFGILIFLIRKKQSENIDKTLGT